VRKPCGRCVRTPSGSSSAARSIANRRPAGDSRQGRPELCALKRASKRLIDHLSNGEVIEVCLADRLDPAAFDMEGSSLNAFQVQKNARFIRKNIMELICIPWIVPVGLAILCGVCIYGWIRTDYRWRMSAETLLHQLEEDQGGSR